MKFLLVSLFISSIAVAAPTAQKKNEIVKKDKVTNEKLKAIIKEEDCDDKAKKPVEIKPESISLSGNTGCSLDEAQK